MFKKLRKICKFEFLYSVVIFLLLFKILCVKPYAGLADNGDFSRVFCPNFLQYKGEVQFFDFITNKYKITSLLFLPIYLNSHNIVVFFTKLLNCVLYSTKIYDVRFLTFFYIIVFCYSIYKIISKLSSKNIFFKFLLALLIFFLFVTNANFLYFFSLYAEPCGFVFLFLSLAFLLKLTEEKSDPKNAIFFLISLFVFLGSKLQYTFLAPIFILTTYFISKNIDNKKQKNTVWLISFLLAGLNIFFYIVSPHSLENVTSYNSVFYGILGGEVSESKSKDYLRNLGINEDYFKLAGTDYFQKDYPINIKSKEFEEEFFNNINKIKIAKFYFIHPEFFLSKLQGVAKNCFLHPYYLGNRTEEFSPLNTKFTHFDFWPELKANYFPKSFEFVTILHLLIFLVLLINLILSKNIKKIIPSFFLCLIMFSYIQFFLPLIGDGNRDGGKQLYMMSVILDIFLFSFFTFILKLPEALINRKKVKNLPKPKIKPFVTDDNKTDSNSKIFFEIMASNIELGVLIFNCDLELEYLNDYSKQIFKHIKNSKDIGRILTSLVPELGLLFDFHYAGDKKYISKEFLVAEKTVNAKFFPIFKNLKLKKILILIDAISIKINGLAKDLLSNVAHEIKTPLTNIKLYTEALLNSGSFNESNLNFLKVIDKESERMKRIINEVLNLTKFDSDEIEIIPKYFNMEDFVEEVINKFQIEANNKNIDINYVITAKCPEMYADREKIEQILQNIISNSLRYVLKGGKISVFSGFVCNEAYIKIKDNGRGIPKQDLNFVFDRFYKVDKHRSRDSGGPGLGLSIAREIAIAHEGRIDIKSEFGEYTEVTLIFPIKFKKFKKPEVF